MKKLSLLLLTLTLCFFTACHKDIWTELENLDQRVTKLEELCKEMNTNITSLQTIVSVLQSNDFITGIVEIKKNGEVIGYTITFGKQDPITIYHGEDGSATAPIIGVAQDTDGVYYWTLNGVWLLDENGNKLPVSGKDGQSGTNGSMPQLIIEEGYWYVSYDNGATWTELGKAIGEEGEKGEKGDSMFQSVTQDENYVYFTLADGTVIKIAKGDSSNESANEDFIFVVTYHANGGEGTMQPDTFYYGQAMKLSASKYINGELIFISWNTKPDGNGIDFQDEQEITLDRNLVLYAKWKEYKSGNFSVSSSKYVSFSLGNVQYHSLLGTYRFAKNQYDYIGENSRRTDSYYDGWVDLLSWRWNYDTSTYIDYGQFEIDNYPSNTWRTLSKDEWEYILKGRTNAKNLLGIAQVNGVNGLILLPDNWICPSGITFKAGCIDSGSFLTFSNHQSFSKAQWNLLESSGAVFLPAAGKRYDGYSETDIEVTELQKYGYYWTSTGGDHNSYCSYMSFSCNSIYCNSLIDHACSVRLVRYVK